VIYIGWTERVPGILAEYFPQVYSEYIRKSDKLENLSVDNRTIGK